MKYLIYSLSKYMDEFLPFMQKAQKEIYPTEEPGTKEDLMPFMDHSYVLGAFNEEEPIAFSAFTVCKDSRSPKKFGTNLFFYVLPEYRKTVVAGKLLVSTEKICKTLGCESFKWDVTIGSDLIEVFDRRNQYKKESIIYSKEL